MNRDEQDWINALNATGNLANTLARTEAQGLQTDAYRRELADKERQKKLADTLTQGLASGKSHEELLKTTTVPGTQPEKKWWQSEADKPVDIPVGPAEVQKGLNEAMKRNIEAYKADFEMKKNKVAPIIKSLPMDKLNTIDFEQFGDNAEAARAVFAEDIKTRSESAQYKKQFDDTIRAGIEQHWKGWSSSVGLAEESIKKGNRVAAMEYANTAINVHNSDSRKFEVNPETGTSGRFYIIQQGKKSYDDKEYAVEDVLKMMKEITPQQFNEHNWATAKETQTFNGASAKDPVILFNENTGKILSAVAEKDPITAAMTWVVHDKGKPIYRGDLQKMYDLGYVSSKGKKEIDANTRRGLAIEGDRLGNKNEKLRGNLINAQIAATKRKGDRDPQELKYNREMITRNIESELAANDIPITMDSDGRFRSDAKNPLTAEQKTRLDGLLSQYGYKAFAKINPDSIEAEWSIFDDDGYDITGISPAGFVPGKESSMRNEVQAMRNKGSEKPEKKSMGLYKSVVPKNSLIDKGVTEARERAGRAFDVGSVPLKAMGLVSMTAVGSAVKKAAQIKILENQLSHDPGNKEIKAELDALKSKKAK